MSQEGITRRAAAAWQWLMRNIAQVAIGAITFYAVYLLRNTDRHWCRVNVAHLMYAHDRAAQTKEAPHPYGAGQ